MKKIFILLTILLITISVSAQKKEKVKGNKIVTDVYNDLDDFNTIEISDNLKVNITQSLTNSYHLKTDENLIDVIKFEVFNNVLKVYTTANIKASKELDINLTIKNVETIILKDDAKLISNTNLILTSLNFNAFDNSTFELDVKVDNSTFDLRKSSSGKIKLMGDNSTFVLIENAFLKGSVVLNELDLKLNNRSDINLTGEVSNLKIKATGSAGLKGKELKTSYADSNSENTTDLNIYTSKELKIYAKDKSSVYVYGNPEIQVIGLNDKAQIIKK